MTGTPYFVMCMRYLCAGDNNNNNNNKGKAARMERSLIVPIHAKNTIQKELSWESNTVQYMYAVL